MALPAAELVKILRGDAPPAGISPSDLAIIEAIQSTKFWNLASDMTLGIRIQNMRLAAAAENDPGHPHSWSMR